MAEGEGMKTVVSLKDLQPGQTGTVEEIGGAEGQRLRLMELGILPGTVVRFVRRAPMGDPLEVEVRGFHLSLRSSEAAGIGISVH